MLIKGDIIDKFVQGRNVEIAIKKGLIMDNNPGIRFMIHG